MVELQLSATPDAPSQARRAITIIDCDDECMSRLELLVSELVTNSVRHAGLEPNQTIRFTAEVDDGRTRVRVCDEGTNAFIAVRDRGSSEPGGLGLFLVDTLADSWGIERNDHTCVWFEVPRYETSV